MMHISAFKARAEISQSVSVQILTRRADEFLHYKLIKDCTNARRNTYIRTVFVVLTAFDKDFPSLPRCLVAITHGVCLAQTEEWLCELILEYTVCCTKKINTHPVVEVRNGSSGMVGYVAIACHPMFLVRGSHVLAFWHTAPWCLFRCRWSENFIGDLLCNTFSTLDLGVAISIDLRHASDRVWRRCHWFRHDAVWRF